MKTFSGHNVRLRGSRQNPRTDFLVERVARADVGVAFFLHLFFGPVVGVVVLRALRWYATLTRSIQ